MPVYTAFIGMPAGKKDKLIYLTELGAIALAELVERVRGGIPYSEFESVLNRGKSREQWVGGTTIWNIEKRKSGTIKRSTLEAISTLTPYSIEDLIAICQRPDAGQLRECLTAEDLVLVGKNLPKAEIVRAISMLVAYVAGLGNKHLSESQPDGPATEKPPES